MRIDPILRALRSDNAPQRQAQRALEDIRDHWLRSPPIARALVELEQYGSGMHLADCPQLDTMISMPGTALRLLAPLLDGMASVLVAHTLGHVPFRHQYQGGIAIIQLAETAAASLSLVTYEELPAVHAPTAQSVCFADGERHECYLAGAAQGQKFELVQERADGAVLDAEPIVLRAGEGLSLAGPAQTKLVEKVEGRLVMLRLGRTAANPVPSREFRLADGRLLHRASGNRTESRDEMMMALLGRMGRRDAVPAISAMTREGSDHLRWQAVRECLALDTCAGFASLTRIARDDRDGLAVPAGALRAQLVESYPQLVQLEVEACPA